MRKENIEDLIIRYANIRKEFEEAKKSTKYLDGNDNYIGIIGEYWARIFLEDYLDKNVNHVKNSKNKTNKSSKWIDYITDKNEYISVKTITTENKSKTSGDIKFHDNINLDENNNKVLYSIIIVMLDEDLFPNQLLYIKDIDNNLKNIDEKTSTQYATRWKNKQNIYFKYYENGFDKRVGSVFAYDKEIKSWECLKDV